MSAERPPRGRPTNRDGWRTGRQGRAWTAVLYEGGERTARHRLHARSREDAEAEVAALNVERLRSGRADVGAIMMWLSEHLEGKGKAEAAQRTRDAWRQLARGFDGLRPHQITPTHVKAFVTAERARGGRDGGIRTALAYLKMALKQGREHGVWHGDIPKIESPPAGRPRERYLTQDEARALIEAAMEPHVRLFLILSLSTAARPRHLLDLTWDRVDLDQRVIRLDNPDRDRTRKGRATVPVNNTAFEALKVAQSMRTCDHVIQWGDRPVKSVRTGFEAAARRAGIEGVSLYTLRHTAGVWMAQAGVPIEQIAEYMGHEQIDTTRKHYARFGPAYLRAAASALDIAPRERIAP